MIEKQYITFTTVHRKDAFLNEMRNFTKRDRYDPECEAYPASVSLAKFQNSCKEQCSSSQILILKKMKT